MSYDILFEPIQIGETVVEHADVGAVLPAERHRLVPRAGLGDDLHVPFALEEPADPGADHLVVIYH